MAAAGYPVTMAGDLPVVTAPQGRIARRQPALSEAGRFSAGDGGHRAGMRLIDRLEHATGLDPLVQAGQRAARLVRPGRIRDVLHGTWLGRPLHPLLAQAATGAWLSAGSWTAHLARRKRPGC